MGFFTNVINYIKNIDIKKYLKKVVPSKQTFEAVAKPFRRRKKPGRAADAEYGFASPPSSDHRNGHQNPAETVEPIYLQVMERRSVVGVVGPTSRAGDPAHCEEEPDGGAAIGRPSIYTDRTQVGINKLMNHLNEKRHRRHSAAVPTIPESGRRAPKKASDETGDLKAYILDSVNEIEMIRRQIHMKSEIVKTVDCNEADLEFVREYLTSCMVEIEDIDAKGTREIESAKEDGLYYARQWYNRLGVQLEAAEDLYVRATLAQLDSVKEKLSKLSSAARTRDADSADVVRRLSQYVDDIESVDTRAIPKIEAVKRATLQLAEELTENIHEDIVNNRSGLIRNSNEEYYNTEIGEDDIYDEVSITSSSENVSVVISDSDSDDESSGKYSKVRRASKFIVPNILIDSSQVQEELVDYSIERNRLSLGHLYMPNDSSENAVPNISNQRKLDSSEAAEDSAKLEPDSGSSSSSTSSIPTVHQELQKASRVKRAPPKESLLLKHKPEPKTPATLTISHQGTVIPAARLSKEDRQFGYTQECLQEILLCRNRLECLADSVGSFRGTANDDEFVFLQENITFSMMALNGIDAQGVRAIQDMRREAMMYGQIWYDELEQKTQGAAVR